MSKINREKFEAWMTAEQASHGSDFEWDERRNCYSQFGIHIAYKAFQSASRESEAQLTALTSQLESVVAENAVSNDRLQKLIQIINNTDNSYCMCGDAMRNHAHGGCGHPTGMFDYHYSQWLESAKETPATSAFLAEVRASGVDAAIEHLLNKFEGTGHIGAPVMALEWLAKDLRQGGAA